MSEHESSTTEADLAAIRALQADASELTRIESLLDRFNVFEAIGFVGQEVKHSHFLAFLLNPKQNHGLGDLFLKRMLREALASADEKLPPSIQDLDGTDLGETLVQRERHNIDLLLTNETHRFAVIVENKVWSMEHSDQLNRYYQVVRKGHPGWRVFGIYLTPHGDNPSHEAYLPLNYGTVCEILDGVMEDIGSALILDVRMSIEHYVHMVRRHIVDDPEVVNLCRDMYRKHQRAFDLIQRYRPDPQRAIRDILIRLIRDNEGLVFAGRSRNEYVYFWSREWEVPALDAGNDSHGFLRFVFHNDSVWLPEALVLFLETSLGDEATRRRLYEMGQKDESLFNDLGDPHKSNNPKLYRRTFLTPELFTDGSDQEREQEIRRQWAEFLDEDLPRLQAALKEEAWIWESVETEDST